MVQSMVKSWVPMGESGIEPCAIAARSVRWRADGGRVKPAARMTMTSRRGKQALNDTPANGTQFCSVERDAAGGSRGRAGQRRACRRYRAGVGAAPAAAALCIACRSDGCNGRAARSGAYPLVSGTEYGDGAKIWPVSFAWRPRSRRSGRSGADSASGLRRAEAGEFTRRAF